MKRPAAVPTAAFMLALVLTSVVAAPPALATGQQTFAAQCSMCHQPDGAGLPGSFPRLKGRIAAIAGSPEARSYPIMVLLHGLYGPITVDGQQISGLMPPVGGQLNDQAVAEVLAMQRELGIDVYSDGEMRRVDVLHGADVAAAVAGIPARRPEHIGGDA